MMQKGFLKTVVTLSFILLISGCIPKVEPDTSEFSNYNSFEKQIAKGLFFIRVINPRMIKQPNGTEITEWEAKASQICGTEGYEIMLFDGEDYNRLATTPIWTGAFISFTMSSLTNSLADGVVLCNNSSITHDEAYKILVDEFYIVPE